MYTNSISKALKFQWKRHHFRSLFLLSVLNAFIVGTKEYFPKCNNVNNAKGLQIVCDYCNTNLRLEVTNQKYWLI